MEGGKHLEGDGQAERPRLTVVVSGTGTEVGKTWVTATVAGQLRNAGLVVAARKPAQSHGPGDVTTDAAVLAAATGEDVSAVCGEDRDYEVAMAPPMAASALGRGSFTVADLVASLQWPRGCDAGFVESAGGVRSPIASDGDTITLIEQVQPDVVLLVADAGLGVINAVRLSLAAMAPVRPLVVLNRFDANDDLHRRNLAWLREVDGLDPFFSLLDVGLRLSLLVREP